MPRGHSRRSAPLRLLNVRREGSQTGLMSVCPLIHLSFPLSPVFCLPFRENSFTATDVLSAGSPAGLLPNGGGGDVLRSTLNTDGEQTYEEIARNSLGVSCCRRIRNRAKQQFQQQHRTVSRSEQHWQHEHAKRSNRVEQHRFAVRPELTGSEPEWQHEHLRYDDGKQLQQQFGHR